MPPPGGSSRWSACCTSGGDLKDYPQSVLFSCDHNAVRSPMAEGIMKKFVGTRTYVQSVGVVNDLEIDGFAIDVYKEIGVALELTRYYHLTVDYWPVMDPTGIGESREQKLNAYRQTRDQIVKRVQELWGV